MVVEKRWVIKDADGNVLNEFEGVANQDFVGQDFNGVIVASVEQTEDVTVADTNVPSNEELLRAERNRILTGTDWTQMPDSPLSDAKKAEWRTYRQALRDLPANTTDPRNPTWPTKPT